MYHAWVLQEAFTLDDVGNSFMNENVIKVTSYLINLKYTIAATMASSTRIIIPMISLFVATLKEISKWHKHHSMILKKT